MRHKGKVHVQQTDRQAGLIRQATQARQAIRKKHENTFICRQLDDLEMAEISELDHFFLISVGTLVLLLQSGYAFLEAGAVRSKNAVNICLR
jgi:hypothetical protein